MSKKTKDTKNIREEYKLKSDAVDRLANADKKKFKKASEEEINKYQKPFLPKVPKWAKGAFIKWWFAGAICFFFYWGLGTVIPNQLDLIFVLWLAMGVATDLLTNNVLRFIQTDQEYEPYIMVPGKKYITLFLNILYALPLMALTIGAYEVINSSLVSMFSLPADAVPLGVGPVGFGIIYTAFDFIFLMVRNFVKKKFSN